ncbi:hypothetical protein BDV98DRAFT_358040 [Pterulicium gracile]|uniref:Uncharacterized protein n=1 Tax=Pterulicium gracile TaxID=1884261 RepID=A0A5C3QR45_9AGAR|nr:hypothetical protein BDV98DRAFT_358040 [Pterula gracilis]
MDLASSSFPKRSFDHFSSPYTIVFVHSPISSLLFSFFGTHTIAASPSHIDVFYHFQVRSSQCTIIFTAYMLASSRFGLVSDSRSAYQYFVHLPPLFALSATAPDFVVITSIQSTVYNQSSRLFHSPRIIQMIVQCKSFL